MCVCKCLCHTFSNKGEEVGPQEESSKSEEKMNGKGKKHSYLFFAFQVFECWSVYGFGRLVALFNGKKYACTDTNKVALS